MKGTFVKRKINIPIAFPKLNVYTIPYNSSLIFPLEVVSGVS